MNNTVARPDVAEQAVDRWTEILPRLGIDPRYLVNVEGPCPRCHGKTKFRFKNEGGRGTFWCNGYQNSRGSGYGSGFQMLEHVFGVNAAEAFKMVREVLNGFDGSESNHRRHKPAANLTARKEERKSVDPQVLKNIWDESVPLGDGVQAAEYLQQRGIGMEKWPSTVRFHKNLLYTHHGTVETPRLDGNGLEMRDEQGRPLIDVKTEKEMRCIPCMVSAVSDQDGKCIGLHRTYLDGNQKARVAAPKKIYGKANGGAIRLFKPIDGKLAVAEGIETAIAFWKLTGIACWATISTAGMKNFVIPQGITKLIIAADNDENDAGLKAAEVLQQKAEGLGVKVKVTMPTTVGWDFLDHLNHKQKPRWR